MRGSCFCWVALGVLSWLATSEARAEQFIVTDVTYTHSADTTSDSHYRVSPLAGTPTNWRSPIDYASGSVRVHLEVKTKPSDTQTRFQVCFEAMPSYGCTDQSPVYTKTGTYEWTTKFEDFYYGGEVDWSKGVSKIALILKDANNNKPQGDPKFVPTDLRVEVALLTSGASYVPPARDGGAGDAGVADAGRSDASAAGDASPDAHDGGAAAPSSDASAPASDAATPASDAGTTRPGSGRDAASPASSSDGGVARDAGASHDDAGDDEEDEDSDSGCSLARSAGGSSWFWSVAAALIATGYRRRRLQRKRAA